MELDGTNRYARYFMKWDNPFPTVYNRKCYDIKDISKKVFIYRMPLIREILFPFLEPLPIDACAERSIILL